MKTQSVWPIVKLKDVCKVRKGTSITRSKVKPGNIPVIAGGQKPAYYHNEANRDGNVVTVSASGAYAGYVQYFDTPIFASDCTTIESLDESLLLTEFVYYALKVQQDRIYKLQHGAGQPHVYPKDLEIIKIPLPPLPEQRRIVAILRKADELRRLRQRANQRARDLLPALFYEMFLEKDRYSDWDKIHLGEITPFITSGSRWWARYYSNTGAKFIRVQNVLDGRLDFSDLAYVNPPEGPEKERSAIQPNDLLITITGTVGRVAVAPNDIGEAYVSQHVAIARTDGSLDPYFIADFINHPLGGQAQITKQNYGQTKPGLNLKQISNIRIPVPPTPLVQQYRQIRDKTKGIKSIADDTSKKISNLINSVLARAFTGELTAAWREAHAEELAAAATERDRLLEQKQGEKPKISVTKPVLTSITSINKVLAANLAPTISEIARIQSQISKTYFPQLPHFTALAESFRPSIEIASDLINKSLVNSLADFAAAQAAELERMVNATEAVSKLIREQNAYYADLMEKMAQIARHALEAPLTRKEIQEEVLETISELIRERGAYITLFDLATDWRLNHLSVHDVEEAVDMLVVLGRLRLTTLKLETEDPDHPYELIKAYAMVTESDLVSAQEIEL